MMDTKDLAADVVATLRNVGHEASGFVHGVTSSLDGAVDDVAGTVRSATHRRQRHTGRNLLIALAIVALVVWARRRSDREAERVDAASSDGGRVHGGASDADGPHLASRAATS